MDASRMNGHLVLRVRRDAASVDEAEDLHGGCNQVSEKKIIARHAFSNSGGFNRGRVGRCLPCCRMTHASTWPCAQGRPRH